jgi:hypothetical protein
MKTNNLMILTLSLAMLSACGKSYKGTYQGTEDIVTNGITSKSNVTITVNEEKNEKVTGRWEGAAGSGTFDGKIEGDRIANVRLVINQSNTNALTTYPYYNPATPYNNPANGTSTQSNLSTVGPTCPGDYSGFFVMSNKDMTGTLNSSTTAASNTGVSCSTLRSVNAKNIN